MCVLIYNVDIYIYIYNTIINNIYIYTYIFVMYTPGSARLSVWLKWTALSHAIDGQISNPVRVNHWGFA